MRKGELLKHVETQMGSKAVFSDRSQLLPKIHILLYGSSYETSRKYRIIK